MFDASCLDCRAEVTYAERPDDITCAGCGLRMYVTADGKLGRYLPDDWRPGGIQGR